MSRFAFFCVVALWLCIPTGLFGEETAYILARDFSADGKVLELNIPEEIDGTRFYFVFQQEHASRPHVEVVLARAGKHSYETRHLPDWQGRMKYVAVGLKEIKGEVKYPTLADDIDMFFAPDPLTLLNINVLSQHRLAALPWTLCLMIVFILFAVFFRVYTKKSGAVALVLGFVVTWAIMDLRMIFDHAWVIYKEESLHTGMPPLNEAKMFADSAAGLIRERTWGMGAVEIGTQFFQYRLAEDPYAPQGSSVPASVWITQHPAQDDALLFQSGKYYLVQKAKP